ncbi:MAG: hypothetical protein DRH26_03505, partial [Deltaproteobacteria bacterium]
MIDPAAFKVRFPEFVGDSDATIQVYIDDSTIMLNSEYWGDKYDLGLSYLTAHYLYKALKSADGTLTAPGGAIAGRAVDGASVNYTTFQPSNESDAIYMTTT